MTYQIEKGVPIPEPITGKGVINKKSFLGTLRAMEVGDSVLVEKPQTSSGAHSRIQGMKFTTRKVSENRTRIWRVA